MGADGGAVGVGAEGYGDGVGAVPEEPIPVNVGGLGSVEPVEPSCD